MDKDAAALFQAQLTAFRADRNPQRRIIPLFAGAITFADQSCLRAAIELAMNEKLPRTACYETVLQSYLFLGFPRMLQGMDALNAVWPAHIPPVDNAKAVTANEGSLWQERGTRLYEQVYGRNHAALRERVTRMSPEIFRWMIIEGYGKVLSRPELPIIDRELAIVAMLTIEAREPQLHSHIRGALNVGATIDEVRLIIDDIGNAMPVGTAMAHRILEKVSG